MRVATAPGPTVGPHGAPALVLRPARAADLDALVALEAVAFATDRLSRRSLRRFAGRSPIMLVALHEQRLLGYALVLVRAGSDLARLYSLAVDPTARRGGIGAALLAAAEQAARARCCRRMRLEAAERNAAALRLYRRRGYREIARLAAYYRDGRTAIRLEKTLVAAA